MRILCSLLSLSDNWQGRASHGYILAIFLLLQRQDWADWTDWSPPVTGCHWGQTVLSYWLVGWLLLLEVLNMRHWDKISCINPTTNDSLRFMTEDIVVTKTTIRERQQLKWWIIQFYLFWHAVRPGLAQWPPPVRAGVTEVHHEPRYCCEVFMVTNCYYE